MPAQPGTAQEHDKLTLARAWCSYNWRKRCDEAWLRAEVRALCDAKVRLVRVDNAGMTVTAI